MKLINLIIIALMFVASWWLYPALPDRLPMHWNIAGQVDNYWPKTAAVWFMPGLAAFLLILFRVIPNLDPKKDKYSLFASEWQIIQTGFIIFFAYLEFITYYLALNPSKDILPLMFIGLGGLFVLLGNFLGKIRQNYFLGIKVPWTLANEDNWNKTHRFAGWTFVLAGIFILSQAYLQLVPPQIIFAAIFLAAGLPVIYSYLLFRNS